MPNIRELLSALIEEDMVEYEESEKMFYLSHVGFRFLEEGTYYSFPKEKSDPMDLNTVMEQLEELSSNKIKWGPLKGLLIAGAIFTIYLFFNPSQRPSTTLDDATLESIKKQMETKRDSMVIRAPNQNKGAVQQ